MKYNIKQNSNKRKAYWINIWFGIALFGVISFSVYAVYNQVYSVKRVVSTKSTPKTYFSSNCMRKEGSRKQLSSTEYTVTVCNYDQDHPDIYNPNVVSYNFSVTLQLKIEDEYLSYSDLSERFAADEEKLSEYKKKFRDVEKAYEKDTEESEDPGKYTVTWTSDDGGNITDGGTHILTEDNSFSFAYTGAMAQSLKARESATDKFKITIPKKDITNTDPEFFLCVEAVPIQDNINPRIYSRLYGAQREEIESKWTGTLAETNTENIDYDFYNYILTGSSSGNLDIMWNSNYFEINQFFTESAISGATFVGGTTPQQVTSGDHANEGWVKLTLKVNSKKTRYDVQFYKVQTETAYIDDNAASQYIDCYFQRAE